MCYLVTFVERSVSHSSILTIVAITVERYYAICLPLRASVVCTKVSITLEVFNYVYRTMAPIPLLSV